MKIQKVMTSMLYLLLCIPIGIYIIYLEEINKNWNSIESISLVISYLANIIMITYNKNINFYLFIKRLTMKFKNRYTSWLVSSKYQIKKTNENIIEEIAKYLISENCSFINKSKDSLKVTWQNKHNFNYRLITNSENSDCLELHFNTTLMDVPLNNIKNKSNELIKFFENVENIIGTIQNKDYEIDIDYINDSPFYSLWLKKLPGEYIESFRCKIKLPEIYNGFVTINKNHLIIKSNHFCDLFKITENYILLQGN